MDLVGSFALVDRLELGVDLPFIPYQAQRHPHASRCPTSSSAGSAISPSRSRALLWAPRSTPALRPRRRRRRLVPDGRLVELHGPGRSQRPLPPRRRVALALRARRAQRRLRRARRARLRRPARRLAVPVRRRARHAAAARLRHRRRGARPRRRRVPQGLRRSRRRRRRPSSPPVCAGARASASSSTPPSGSACRAATARPIAPAPSSASST